MDKAEMNVVQFGKEDIIATSGPNHTTLLHYKGDNNGFMSVFKYEGGEWVDKSYFDSDSVFVYNNGDPVAMSLHYDKNGDGKGTKDEQLKNGEIADKFYIVQQASPGTTKYYAYADDNPACADGKAIWLSITECTESHSN